MKKITFKEYPQFTPNLTPAQIFKRGSFGGTYWRKIYSRITGKYHTNCHLKYPKNWWLGLKKNFLVSEFKNYDVKVNYYGVKVGTTLDYWQSKGWISKYDPRGWVQWYCSFYFGRRTPDDLRQINRWLRLAGPNGRFRKMLIRLIVSKGSKYSDTSISPKIRQTLQHWAYVLTSQDMNPK